MDTGPRPNSTSLIQIASSSSKQAARYSDSPAASRASGNSRSGAELLDVAVARACDSRGARSPSFSLFPTSPTPTARRLRGLASWSIEVLRTRTIFPSRKVQIDDGVGRTSIPSPLPAPAFGEHLDERSRASAVDESSEPQSSTSSRLLQHSPREPLANALVAAVHAGVRECRRRVPTSTSGSQRR